MSNRKCENKDWVKIGLIYGLSVYNKNRKQFIIVYFEMSCIDLIKEL